MLDKLFLSTPSARRATKQQLAARGFNVFLSTPSARRATYTEWYKSKGGKISIHALREEGDQVCYAGRPERHNFYPRPPRGGRHFHAIKAKSDMGFLSTPSARRATRQAAFVSVYRIISIHALREEGDVVVQRLGLPIHGISIHALREEGDVVLRNITLLQKNFYPRPPRGGRRGFCQLFCHLGEFLSTPSARRATIVSEVAYTHFGISIHALREEGDRFSTVLASRAI